MMIGRTGLLAVSLLALCGVAAEARPGKRFNDCGRDCPDMIAIAPGTFSQPLASTSGLARKKSGAC